MAYLAELVKRLPERKITGREAVEAVGTRALRRESFAECARDLDGVLATLSSNRGARRAPHAEGALRGLDCRGIERFDSRRRSSGPARGFSKELRPARYCCEERRRHRGTAKRL